MPPGGRRGPLGPPGPPAHRHFVSHGRVGSYGVDRSAFAILLPAVRRSGRSLDTDLASCRVDAPPQQTWGKRGPKMQVARWRRGAAKGRKSRGHALRHNPPRPAVGRAWTREPGPRLGRSSPRPARNLGKPPIPRATRDLGKSGSAAHHNRPRSAVRPARHTNPTPGPGAAHPDRRSIPANRAYRDPDNPHHEQRRWSHPAVTTSSSTQITVGPGEERPRGHPRSRPGQHVFGSAVSMPAAAATSDRSA
jgi:hypothetical protein